MQQLQLEAEHKYFPEGFEPSAGRVALAADDARVYMEATYGEAIDRGQD